MTEAAKIVGIERSTLYRHIDEKGISVIKKDGSHPKIDVSELIRVYGDQVNPENLDTKNKTDTTKKVLNETKKDTDNEVSLPQAERIALIEEERKREREQYQEQIEHLKNMLQSEQEERRKITALLTDQRSDKSDNNDKSVEWQKSLKALESRIANQEKAEKDRKEREQKLLDENRRIKQAYSKQKKALEEEKSKSIWQKLFG